MQGRWDILKVHAKNKKLADDVNLESVAMRVPGAPHFQPEWTWPSFCRLPRLVYLLGWLSVQ